MSKELIRSWPTNERFMSYDDANRWRAAIHNALRDNSYDYGILRAAGEAIDWGTQRELTELGDCYLRMHGMLIRAQHDAKRARVYLVCGLLLLALKGTS